MNHMITDKVISVNEVEVVTNADEVAVADMIEVVVEDGEALIEVDFVDADVVVVHRRCPSVLQTMLIHIRANIWSAGRVCSNGKFVFHCNSFINIAIQK